jgi:4-hydroxybenzoate polyprenyltransferase
MSTLAELEDRDQTQSADGRVDFSARVQDHLTALRLPEVTLMVGLFVIGSAFALDRVTADAAARLTLYGTASWFFICSVYAMNAWGGYKEDLGNPKFPTLGRVRPSFFLRVVGVSFVVFVVLFSIIDLRILALAIASYSLWTLYCVPRVGLKLFPVPGAAVHVVSQIVHFQMGWLLFRPLSWTSLLLSVYFAIVWTAGYLNHQVMDHPYDSQARVPTSAVCFGVRRVDIASALMFSLGGVYWAALYFLGLLERWELWPFLGVWMGLVVAKLGFSLFAAGTVAEPVAYRLAYRLLVGLGCAVYVAIKFLG